MTQYKRILKILDEKGQAGMNSYEYRMEFIQLPARIWDLKQMGHKIIEKQNPDRSVNYILVSNQKSPEPLTENDFIFVGNKAIRKEEPKQQNLL